MSSTNDPLAVKTQEESELVYAGDVSPQEAWDRLAQDPDAMLVDVRTTAEWQYVGLPDLSRLGKEPVLLHWQIYPKMTVHEDFVLDLEQAGAKPAQTILFLCRSGVRSRHAAAAMTKAGFTACYNIVEGFEGDKDDSQHRGCLGGWKYRGLPWVQK